VVEQSAEISTLLVARWLKKSEQTGKKEKYAYLFHVSTPS